MPIVPFTVIAFDLDGTLADTAPDLAHALNLTLSALERETVEPQLVRGLIGHGARSLLRRGLATSGEASEELVDRALPIFIEHYAANICNGTRAYPGLEAALDGLSSAGVALAICTNKPEALTHALLDALAWKTRFQSIVGGDTLPVRKPDPAPLHEAIARAGGGRAAFVGDSITDADTPKRRAFPLSP